MNIIKAIGKALVLNTINNLVPGTKVKISINSLAFCVDGRAKLYKNAQYVSYDLPTENYIIPLTKEIDGNITLDFTEAPYAFGRYSVEEFDKLQEDWLPYEVEQEKQTSDKEYIARYSILTLSREFYDEATSEPQEKERLDFIFNVFQKKISHCYEKKTIESLFNYYKTDFISQLEKSNEFIDEQERAESIEGFKQKVEPYFTKIFKKLEKQLHKIQNTQHNENMSNDDMQTLLDKYLLDEDYANASLMRDKMKEKGYAPKS